MKDPLQPTGPILQSPPRAEAQRFTYSSGDRPLAGYTIKRGIGRGGFGEVYYGTSDGGKEVALKLVQRNLEVELRGVGHCLNLKHGNLVGLYDVKQADNGDYWVVMEYVAGECLIDVIDRYPQGLPLAEALQWMKGICGAVGYLHDRGIVHRDLKPANLFMEEGIVKVGDYGLSKFITHSRRSGQTESVGTVHYMAPEIAGGRYGKEIDVYATGVILFEMLSGQVPFEGESVGEVLMKHLTAEPDLEAVPERFRAVVGRALAKDPSQRYTSIAALLDDLERAAGNAGPASTGVVPVRAQAVAPRGPLDLTESDFVTAAPAAPRGPVPPPPPEISLWASFLREDAVVCWMRRKWQGLSPNNPWHVITFTGVVLLLLLSVGLWGVVPIAAMCYVAAALMVRWLKGPSTQAVASAIEPRGASPSPRPAPLQPAATGDSAEATQLRKPTDRNPPAGRAIPSGLFVIMALFLGAGLGLLTGGIVAALRFDEETAAFLGMSSGFFVFATALFCWFPRSRWWRAVVALFLGTCVGMAAGALGMSEWRDYEAALLGVGAGLLSGGLLLSRALRGVGWWRAVASPLIAAGVGLLVGWMAALSGIDEEVGALLGVGCGLLVCAISGYQLAADRPAKRAAHTVRRRSWGHRIGWTVTFTIIVLLVMAMMLVPTATRRHDAATVVRTRSVVRSHGGPHGPACADIEMILKTYPFPNDRARELTKISQRAQLSSNEQVHLIDVALREVAYPNEQVRVLLPLATSPELTPEARFHLSTNIDRISFRSERERIYRALIQNPQTDAAQQEGDSTVEPSEAQSKSNDAVANEPSSDGASAPELPPEKNE